MTGLWPSAGSEPSERDFAAASLVTLPFLAYLLVVAVWAPPTPAEWSRADPILFYLPRAFVVPVVLLTGVVVALGWTRSAKPSRADLGRALLQAAAGVALAALVSGALRLWFGPTLPALIPAEESAGPGLVLNMSAGAAEEILFRSLLLSLSFVSLRRRASAHVALAISCVATGLAFAALHQLAPVPSPAIWFVTRTLVPGVAMSLVYLRLGPSLLVAAHCAAHVLIPLLFAPPS